MSVTLSVLSFKNQPITEINSVSIGINGGGIGRSDDNALVLPDTEKFVSRHHASISYENGAYFLSDSSLGGVFINNRESPLHNATERLANGMTIKVGEYEIAVSVVEEQVTDDFLFVPEPEINSFLQVDEPWIVAEDVSLNSLMNDNFPSHDELVQSRSDASPTGFESALPVNQSPLFDSYIAPNITTSSSSAHEEIPDNFSFDDFFSDSISGISETQSTSVVLTKATVDNEFEDFFGAALGDMAGELEQPSLSLSEEFPVVLIPELENAKEEKLTVEPFGDLTGKEQINENSEIFSFDDELNQHESDSESVNSLFESEPSLFSSVEQPPSSIPETETNMSSVVNDSVVSSPDTNQDFEILVPDRQFPHTPFHSEEIATKKPIETINTKQAVIADTRLFNAFLQGAAVECNEIGPEQQTETLHRIGLMFRKLIDGTVAVLRSRAEFKSLCRVNMTVIRSANNNPLKFTVSTDDVLRQLIENKTDGFLASTTAIEESFNDIMNHQLAMQAGIQASLTDLLKTFDPKIIEKQFEQGLVLQKKSKCWDKYEETYRNTVDEAVENFFGEEFVKAYEKQMSQLTNARRN